MFTSKYFIFSEYIRIFILLKMEVDDHYVFVNTLGALNNFKILMNIIFMFNALGYVFMF